MTIRKQPPTVKPPGPQAGNQGADGSLEEAPQLSREFLHERALVMQARRRENAMKAHAEAGLDPNEPVEVSAVPDGGDATNRPRPPAPGAAPHPGPPDAVIDWSVPTDFNVSTVHGWLEVLADPGHAVELRALEVDPGGRGFPHTAVGFYDRAHLRDMAREALLLSGEAKGVYFTLNPLIKDLLARVNNKTKKSKGGDAATDKEVVRRRWLLVDCDPVRTAGVSASGGEKALARQCIEQVMAELKRRVWPDPVVADSGNGYHALYRIALAADDGGLIKRCLTALATRFDTAAVKVDATVFNPSRICKLYGTWARKGDGTPERPHRRSAILHVPEPPEVVPVALLESLAADVPAVDSSRATAKAAAPATEVANVATILDRARAHLAQLPPSVQGEDGSGKAFAAACALVVGFGLSVEQARPLFVEFSDRCQPPWSEPELLHKLEDARAKAVEEPDRVGHLLKPGKGKGKTGESDANLLIRLATSDSLLFQTPDQKPYAALTVAGHRETHTLGGKAYKGWLTGLYYDATGRTPNPETFRGALSVLEHVARRGPLEPVHVRTAEVPDPADPNNPTYFVDLANDDWQAVRVNRDGWEVVDDPPVRFRRPGGMRPLPNPVPGGSLDGLRGYVNIHHADWVLFRAALTFYFRPRGPYPILVFSGEMGTAKTTTCEVTRSTVDPHVSLLRAAPREERDLVIAAVNSGVVGIDNLSHVPDWLSDGLCRIASGGGMSTRALYTDDEEVHFSVQKPIIINGIEDVAKRGDLLDRSLLFGLPEIPESRRRTEAEFWAGFRSDHPGLLGALLDTVARTLAVLPEITLDGLPRMADFARWGEAVGLALGDEPGAFLAAYGANRALACEVALEGSMVATAIRSFITTRGRPWSGTSSSLFAELDAQVDQGARRSAGWPKSPNGLGGALRRATPGLRAVGIGVEHDRNSRARNVTLTPPARRPQ